MANSNHDPLKKPTTNINGSSTSGWRIYSASGEQLSPPFHHACQAWRWGTDRGIRVSMDGHDHQWFRSPGGLPGQQYCPNCGVTRLRGGK